VVPYQFLVQKVYYLCPVMTLSKAELTQKCDHFEFSSFWIMLLSGFYTC